jgi:hypothetical protein
VTIETAKTAAETTSIVVGWVDKVTEYFQPFRPEIKSMVVNYKNRRSEINLLLTIPDGIRRKVHSVEIPAYQNFAIHDMLDETFTRVGGLWRYEDGKWKMDPSKLPKSEKYFVMLRGAIPQETLNQLVRVQPAMNRDQTEDVDRFWLDCMLRNVSLVEKIWQELNIEEVSVGVKVGIERCFSATLPKEVKQHSQVVRQFLLAGRGSNREELQRAWRNMRVQAQTSKVGVDEIVGVIQQLTTGEAFGNFLAVDQPYTIGEVRREERYVGLFPVQMGVEATAELGLKRHTATGFLSFKKKLYNEEIKRVVEKLET